MSFVKKDKYTRNVCSILLRAPFAHFSIILLQFSLHVGAKLLKLKDSLQATMRLAREKARQKRQELYRLDNEDLFGDGEEQDEDGNKKEEAELTDQTDTDYDPDEDNIKDDELEGDDDDDDEDEEMDEEDFEEPVRIFSNLTFVLGNG